MGNIDGYAKRAHMNVAKTACIAILSSVALDPCYLGIQSWEVGEQISKQMKFQNTARQVPKLNIFYWIFLQFAH